jgi:hypothetical protein
VQPITLAPGSGGYEERTLRGLPKALRQPGIKAPVNVRLSPIKPMQMSG